MEEWDVLFSVTATAAATLTGLIFVGVSINLSKILVPNSTLPNRALIALIYLLTILLLSICLLIPEQSNFAIGIENLFIAIIVWLITIRLDTSNFRKSEMEYKRFFFFKAFLNQLSTIPYLISGWLFLNNNEAGLYWIVFGFSISFLKAFSDSWVLLVEINR